jgi:hypothetical protein
MKRDLMVDIETLGNQSNSIILSIGAAEFNIITGEIHSTFYSKITLESNLEVGLQISPSTLKWWLQQNPGTLNDLLNSRHTISQVLESFSEYIKSINLRAIWGNSARFDLGLLQNAYNKCNIDLPWNFRKERCYRTIVEEAGIIDKGDYTGVLHDALDDCKNQIKTLVNRYKLYNFIIVDASSVTN